MEQIYADVAAAAELLPIDFKNVNNEADMPSKYREIGLTIDEYNRALGGNFSGRMSGRIARTIAAQAALLAASPAFSAGSGVEWAEAADKAAEVLDLKGGIAGIYDKATCGTPPTKSKKSARA